MKILILTLFLIGYSFQDPLDLPKESPDRNYHILARLIHQNTSKTYSLEEYLGQDGRGRINVKDQVSSQSWSIFYQLSKDDYRLVMTESECSLHKFSDKKWDSKLPGIESDVLNAILMLGPSIVHRLQGWHHVPDKTESKPFRGHLKFHIAKYRLGSQLDFTEYIPLFNGLYFPLLPPTRLEIDGYLSEEIYAFQSEPDNIIIDYFLYESVENTLEQYVTPTQGIGCPVYLGNNGPLPSNKGKNFRFSEKIYRSNSNEQLSREVQLSDENGVARVKTYLNGESTETILDYNIGVEFKFDSKENCTYGPISDQDYGYVRDSDQEIGHFDVKKYLWMNGPLRYIGQIMCKDRGILCDIWEETDYKTMLDGNRYDKVVTTIYFASQKNAFSSKPISLVRTGWTGTKTSKTKKYIYRREIFDFEEIQSIPISEVKECFPEPGQRKYFEFDLKLTDGPDLKEAIPVAAKNIIGLEHGLHTLLTNGVFKNLKLSYTRIPEIEFEFRGDSIIAKALVLDRPQLLAAYVSAPIQVKKDFAFDFSSARPQSLEDCAESAARGNRNFIFCPADGQDYQELSMGCRSASLSEKIPEDLKAGVNCRFYQSLADSSKYLVGQSRLSKLNIHLEQDWMNGHNVYSFRLENPDQSTLIYKLSEFNEISNTNEYSPEDLLAFAETKLLVKPGRSILSPRPGNIKSLADCYRACEDSSEISCRMFSYCSSQSGVECVLTSEYIDSHNGSDLTMDSSDCAVYGKQFILDFTVHPYQMHSSRESLNRIDGKFTEESCAKACYMAGEEQCETFEFCTGNHGCYLTNKTLSQSYKTQYRDDCSLYSEKHLPKYSKTGSILVDEYFAEEIKLSLDQCASLCYTSSGEKICSSFNYCPEASGYSVCQFSSKNISTPEVKTKSTAFCSNYQLAEHKHDKHSDIGKRPQVSASSSKLLIVEKKIAGFTSFGIILSFFLAGLVTGSVGFTITQIFKRNRQFFRSNRAFNRKLFNNPQSEATL